MYFKRKIDAYLDEWLNKEKRSPVLIVGIRQCGKTESIQEFARRNNLTLIEMNFWTHEEYIKDFEGSLDVDVLIEAKAKNGNTKSSKTIMKNKEHYGKTKLIKIGDYNVGCSEDILTIPHYLTFLLGKYRF
ncbi:MAG: hypothetical protein PUK09_04510 [Bacilli bacterium]|nr:hypothetical protein [Bacilli bacterium]